MVGAPETMAPRAQWEAHGTRDQDWPGGAEGSGARSALHAASGHSLRSASLLASRARRAHAA